MAEIHDRRNFGDLYIGLHLAAQSVEPYTAIALETPLWPERGMYSTLGSPDIWETISGFLQTVLSGAWSPAVWGWLGSVVVTPFRAWLASEAPLGGKWIVDASVRYLVAFLSDLESFGLQWVDPYFGSFINWIWGLPSSLAGQFLEWYGYGQAQIERLAAWWGNRPGPILDLIGAVIEGAGPESILTLLNLPAQALEQVDRLAAWWGNRPGPILDLIGAVIEGAGPESILTLLNLPAQGLEQIERLASWWDSVNVPGAGGLWNIALTALADWWLEVWGDFETGWERVLGVVGDSAEAAIARYGPTVREWIAGIETIPRTYLEFAAAAAGTDLALDPSRALETVGSLYGMALGAGSSAHVLSTALNAVPTLNWVGASQLSGFVAQAAGFDPLTRATYGILVDEALGWPLRYYWNEMLRPRLPTEGTIFLMGRKRGLTREEFHDAMAKQGHPDWWIDRQYQFFWTDPSPYWLLRMSENATPELHPSSTFLPWLEEWLPNWQEDRWAWFRMKLMLAGFEDTDIGAFISGFQSRRVGPAITQVKTSVRAMVREGYWGREEARAALRPLGVREEEIEYIILAEEIDYQNRFNDGEVSYYTEAYRKDEISRQDFGLVLSSIIVRPERVAQIVAREDTRKLPKPKPLVEAAEDPLTTSLIRSAVTSYTAAYRRYDIDLEDLRLGLTVVLQDPELVAALVDAEARRYRPVPSE